MYAPRPSRGRMKTPAAAATRSVRIPEDVAKKLEARLEGSAFDSVDAFVAFVLGRLLEEQGGPGFTEEDERVLKERLRSLGYID
jgi:Arc/MetJ-type ribon-helix-helix transcriptional regulator